MHHNTLKISPHFFGCNPKCLNALIAHPLVSPLVALNIVVEIMCEAIDLDGESGGTAIEIEYEWTARMLLAKSKPGGASLQDAPKPDLRRAQALTKLARSGD
ncbi:hypothetical protein LZ536_02990 [Sphingomonas sp. SE158]|uniref:Uncharacterized protein n=1 Tax=Sphingomonas alba TaxID=2908208 RepID=A0ABT0RK67_9SPHN|nr:hypothetical protein [Sphingomonas alba]MCL6682867.1 hypothetical protein [Sphingomonas alba]